MSFDYALVSESRWRSVRTGTLRDPAGAAVGETRDTVVLVYSFLGDFSDAAILHQAAIGEGAQVRVRAIVNPVDPANPDPATESTNALTGDIVGTLTGPRGVWLHDGTIHQYNDPSEPRDDDFDPPYDMDVFEDIALTVVGQHTITFRADYDDGTVEDHTATFSLMQPALTIESGPSASPSSTSAIVSVTTSSLVESMTVEYREAGSGTWLSESVSGQSTTSPAVTLTGLTTETDYEFRISDITDVYAQSIDDLTIRSFATFAVAVAGARGPDGTHWPPNTPAYTTPATTFITNMSQLQGAINDASDGDVIEIAPHTFSGRYDIRGGSSAWAQNVLVRPPLGQRQSVIQDSGSVYLWATKVTIAGFHINGAMRFENATDSYWARIVLGAQGMMLSVNDTDCGFYEVVAPEYGWGNDRCNFKSDGGLTGGDNIRPVLIGSYLKGRWRTIGADPAEHADTVQYTGLRGGRVLNPLIEDTVLLTSADKSIQDDVDTYNMVLRNIYANQPSTATEDPIEGYEYNGSYVITWGGIDGECYDSDIVGGTYNGAQAQAYSWAHVHRTRYTSWGMPIADAQDNTVMPGGRWADPPPIPDLDTIWD